MGNSSSSQNVPRVSNLERPVFLNKTHVSREPVKLKLKKHHFGNTFEVKDQNGAVIFIIPAKFFSIHGTKTITDGNKKAIAKIDRKLSPLGQWRQEYKCYPDNGDKSSYRNLTPLFKTEVDIQLFKRDPTVLTFQNRGARSGSQGVAFDRLEYKNKAWTRYNEVKYNGIVVATIKENIMIAGARSYDIEIGANMDKFLIVGLAIIHDDIEERKRQQRSNTVTIG